MPDTLKLNLSDVEAMPDPVTGAGEVFLFPEALGQDGRPYVIKINEPAGQVRQPYRSHGDVVFVYTDGEHHVDGEGVYRAGDTRWVKAGHVHGPETAGPDGASWWMITHSDPSPVPVEAGEAAPAPAAGPSPGGGLQRFARPYDWDAIDAVIRTTGGVILEGFLNERESGEINAEFDAYLADPDSRGAPNSGSSSYDAFLGHNTVRLHGLAAKTPAAGDLIAHDELVDCAERIIGPMAHSVILNAGELIQIHGGEPAQALHRDTDTWQRVPQGEAPLLVNAIVALDEFTLDNGATYVVPESWTWARGRSPKREEFVRAEMKRGDCLVFRGDLIHGGGENVSGARRRAVSISYCAGWLRPVECSFLNVSRETAKTLLPRLQALLGYAMHDASSESGGLLGLYENGDPRAALVD